MERKDIATVALAALLQIALPTLSRQNGSESETTTRL
jgi:hypothetical protein